MAPGFIYQATSTTLDLGRESQFLTPTGLAMASEPSLVRLDLHSCNKVEI
jgi:hypothetical protein